MTKLFKNSKQVLSFVLAFAVLAVSLFTGVVINSDAACADEVVKYWDGTTMTEPTKTDDDGNILISKPSELAWLVENGSTAEAKYKVEDGVDAFIMQPETVVDAEELMAIDSYEETKTYFETLAASETKPVNWLVKAANYSATGAFLGTFDGNGIEIYGLYYNANDWKATSLFPHVGANVTIKNLAVRNSYLAIQSYAGAVFGVSADGGDNDRITVDSVAVTGSWIYNTEASSKNNGTPDDTSDDYIQYFTDRSGMMFGRVSALIDLSNCFVYANKVTNANNQDLPYAFSPSLKNQWKTTELNHSYSNCVLLGGYPYNPTSYNAYIADLYSNVYTDMAVTEGKYTYNDSQMAQISVDGVKGAAGKSAMNLDWDTVWFANAGMPELRVFHNISDEATAAENGHTVKCADCDLVSVELDHTYGADDKCTACGATRVCGSGVVETWGDTKSTLTGEATVHNISGTSEPRWYDNTFELLDPNAENSETNPYIIDSAEGLAWLATKATAAETTGKWYKVADGIKAFNMNTKVDMSGDMTAAGVEAALNTTCQMKTWWGGNFAGSFDGNGVTIYGVQGYNTQYGGSGSLFGKVEVGATFKNFELKNSYFKGDRAGSIFDNANGAGTITVENVVLTGNVLVVTRSNGAESFGGVLFARAGSNKVDVKNCLAYNNIAKHQGYYGEKTGYDVTYGFMGNSSKVNGVNPSIENTIILDCLPFTAQYSYSSTSQATYSNVYTNMIDVEVTNTMQESGPYTTTYTGGVITQEDGGYKLVVELGNKDNSGETTDLSGTVGAGSFYAVTAEGIKGAAGKEAMANLDWNNVWFAVEGGMPELRAFHTGFEAATDNGDGTHSETCNCGLVGAAVAHTFDKEAADGKCTVCAADCAHAEENIAWVSNNDATCLTADTGHYECTACGLQDIEMENPDFVPGHTFKDVEAIPADCQGTGTIAHKLCTVCNNAFATTAAIDEPIENALDSTVDPIKDHTAKKDSNGDILYNMDESGHSKTCSVCKEVFDEEGHVGDYDKDADGHTGTCTVCKMATTGKEKHTYVDGVCSTCTYECLHSEENIVWVSNNDGACDKADTGHYECTACGLQDIEMENPDFVATEHKWIDDGEPVELDYMDITETACKKQAQKCEKCGAAGEDKIIGHTAGEWQTPWYDRNFVAPCAGDGQHTEILSCAVCMFEMETKTVTDPKTGHVFDEYEAKESTCTMYGNIAYKYCSVCNYSFAADAAEDEAYANALTDEQINLELVPENHVWEEYECTATCVSAGIAAHKFCTECYLLVVDGEATDVTINWDEFYKVEYDDDWNATPIGIGAKLDAEIPYIENEAFAAFIAENYPDLGLEVPAYPENTNDWDAMDAYYADYYAVTDVLDLEDANWREAWGKYWLPILEDLQTEAYHEALLLAAEEAEFDMTAPADPEAHAWEEVEAADPTCEEPGCVAHKLCANCLLAIVGEEEIQLEIDLDALNPENFNSEEEWLAAIEEAVLAAYDEAGILIPAAHKLSEVKEVAATTEKEGTKAHYACSECDKLFADAEGKEEVKAEDLVIAKLAKDDNKADGDNSDKSPATGESVAAVAAVAALMGAAFVLVRKAKKA